MQNIEILEIAEKLAVSLGIRIKDRRMILKNMESEQNPVTTILHNKN